MAIDCGGSLEVLEVEDNTPEEFARIERFGETDAPTPPCPQPIKVTLRPAAISGPAVVLPPNRFKFGRLKLNRKKGTGLLFVKSAWSRQAAGQGDLRADRRQAFTKTKKVHLKKSRP